MTGVATSRERSRAGLGLPRAALAIATLLAPLAGQASTPPPACIASTEIVPADAVVGQQLLYRLEILAREDVSAVEWTLPPSFPGFRVERLPGRPQAGVVERDGATYRAREEHRALFAERPGEHRTGVAGIRCALGRGEHARSIEAEVPEARVSVRALPATGAPASFAGVVGPVALRLRIAPRRVALGEAIHLQVTLQGAGNLWDAPDPLPDLAAWGATAGVEVFRRRPELRLVPGTQLSVRRLFRYDLVPTAAGELTLPAASLDVYDPAARAYARIAGDAATLTVAPAVEARGAPAQAPDPSRTRTLDDEDANDGLGAAALAGLALLAGVAGMGGWRARRRRRPPARAREALAALRSLEPSQVDAAALARALRAGLASHLPNADLPVEEVLAEGGLEGAAADAAELLVALDRARFDRSSAPPERRRVEAALERLAGR